MLLEDTSSISGREREREGESEREKKKWNMPVQKVDMVDGFWPGRSVIEDQSTNHNDAWTLRANCIGLPLLR